MKKYLIILLFCIFGEHLQANKNIGKGFYKDVFMDSGIKLKSNPDLFGTRYLGLSMDIYMGIAIQNDSVLQNMLICGNPLDENGILLYPDGAPRFRMIYVNGGISTAHGRSLGEEGRERFRQFIAAGGSYLGTCAGCFIASIGIHDQDSIKDTITCKEHYFGIWPGYVRETKTWDFFHKIIFEKNCPLFNYYDFGGDGKVDSILHWNGAYADENFRWPEGTEVLARYGTAHLDRWYRRILDGKPVIWAYKANEHSGRVIPSGSHPEKMWEGEGLQLMGALMKYAMDGNGVPSVKGELKLGEERMMTASTHDNNPAYTKIGDKQYHHFTITVPEGLDTLTIRLKPIPGYENYDMYLFANPDDFAWKDTAKEMIISKGFEKNLRIPKPKAGKYYISVFCDTTVDTIFNEKGHQYYNRIDVLNGVPYIIGANIKPISKENNK